MFIIWNEVYKKKSIPIQAAGTFCNIVITDGLSTPLTLNEVLFGDVWICSGQSNMERSMSSIVNATEEIAASAPYDRIRFMMTTRVTSNDVELEDNKPALPWSRPSEAANLGRMSAVCFLHARRVYDGTGIPQVSVLFPC
jgi:sialate O-acetylesterase